MSSLLQTWEVRVPFIFRISSCVSEYCCSILLSTPRNLHEYPCISCMWLSRMTFRSFDVRMWGAHGTRAQRIWHHCVDWIDVFFTIHSIVINARPIQSINEVITDTWEFLLHVYDECCKLLSGENYKKHLRSVFQASVLLTSLSFCRSICSLYS